MFDWSWILGANKQHFYIIHLPTLGNSDDDDDDDDDDDGKDGKDDDGDDDDDDDNNAKDDDQFSSWTQVLLAVKL